MLTRFLCWLAAIIVLLITLSVVYGVVRRYIFVSPVGWPYEAISYGLLGTVALALSCTQEKKMHVRVDLFLHLFPQLIRDILELVSLVVFLFSVVVIAWSAWETSLIWFKEGVQATITRVHLGLVLAFLFAGAVVLCLKLSIQIVQSIKKLRMRSKPDRYEESGR